MALSRTKTWVSEILTASDLNAEFDGVLTYLNTSTKNFNGTITVGVDDTGYDVKFFGATSGAYMLWDASVDDLKLVGAAGLTVAGDIDVDGTTNLDVVDIDGNVQLDGTLTVGVDADGYDVKLFGGTSGAYVLWDESADDLKLVGAAGLTVAGDIDVDGTTNLDAVDIDGNVTVGVNDTGHDVKFFGATSGAYMLWDESADDLKLVGAADLVIAADLDVDGTTNLDEVDVDGAVNFAADVTFADGADIITATAGTSNFRAGVNAGNSITSGGNYNVAVGDEAGTAITTGDSNTAVGALCLDANTTGYSNVAVGESAMGANTEGFENVVLGVSALDANTTGDANTAVGHATLSSAQTANNNTAVGHKALFANTSGANNVAVGYNAGLAVTTGVTNTLVGASCHDNLTIGTLNIALGYNLAPSGVDVDSEIVIGNSITGAGTNTVRIGTAGGTATLGLDGSDTSWAAASDSRLKKDIADSTAGLSFVKDLRPVTFKWQAKDAIADSLPQYDANSSDPIFGEGKAHHGFVAQEVKAVIDAHSDVLDGHNIWHEDPDGTQQMSQGNFVPMLVKAIQEQQTLIEALTARITILEG
jgi:hypothetical protein